MSNFRAAGSVISIAIGLAFLAVPAAAASPSTRYVDDDGTAGRAGCNGARSVPTRVQRAIHDAGPGDTILVCPGTYTEQLTIRGARDGLTLKAVEPWTANIRTPHDLAGPPTALVLIDGVDRVRLQSLRLAIRTAEPCDRLHYGVLVRDAHKTGVRSLRVGPVGSNTIGPCGYSRGIVIAQGSSAFIGYNLIRDFTDEGIWVKESRTTATVHRNSIRYFHLAEGPRSSAAVGIQAFDVARVIIRANVIRGGPGPGWHTPVLDVGVMLGGKGSLVARNSIRRVFTGILAEWSYPAHEALVRDNVISDGPPDDYSTGMYVEDGSTYSGNRVTGYDMGVYAEAGFDGTRVPTFRGNDFRGNDSIDCYDDGANADGAQGIWIGNLGDTSQPAGICSPGP